MRPRRPTRRPAPPRVIRPGRATRRGVGMLAGLLTVAALSGAAAGGWGPYEVGPGDSLWSLAERHGTTVERIRTMNGLSTDDLKIGELLYLPGSRPGTAPAAPPGQGGGAGETGAAPPGGHVVEPGESLSLLAARAGLTVAELAELNGLDPGDGLQIGQLLLIVPPGSPVAGATGTAAAGTPAAAMTAPPAAPGPGPRGAAAPGAAGAPPRAGAASPACSRARDSTASAPASP
ncbi:LysM peptidoglycan-binding domain-containing protein, partial [Frankia sp. CNm7]|nr:LysM peptidoglycan-binding domain-containing protein [Frankia nepalensis]